MNQQLRTDINLLLGYVSRCNQIFIGKEYEAYMRLKEYMEDGVKHR